MCQTRRPGRIIIVLGARVRSSATRLCRLRSAVRVNKVRAVMCRRILWRFAAPTALDTVVAVMDRQPINVRTQFVGNLVCVYKHALHK